jgi:hypothetical protein
MSPPLRVLPAAERTDLARALQLATLPKVEQGAILAAADPQVVLKAARQVKKARRVQRKREKEERVLARLEESHPLEGKSYQLIHADILEALVQIEPGSVDVILTDPPYPKEFLDCYSKLAQFACVVLKPGGSLLAMAGQSHLPAVLDRLRDSDLVYQWTLTHLTPEKSTTVFGRKVLSNAKPVFWFVKGRYAGEYVRDLVTARDRPDQSLHDWQQSEDAMRQLLERYTVAGEMVCDPFCGAGTTGVAAVGLGRLFVGVDFDAAAIATSAERLAGVGAASLSSIESPRGSQPWQPAVEAV